MRERRESKLRTAETNDIFKLLPHRYPFLLVDRIIDMDGDRTATGIKNVSANEPYFQGHFPRNPIMPGMLLIEGLAQTAGAPFYEYRRARIYSLTSGIPPILWYTVAVGAIINLILMWLFDLRPHAHWMLGGLIAFYLGRVISVDCAYGPPLSR